MSSSISSRFIPAPDAGFNDWQNTWYNSTEQHLGDWEINDEAFAALEAPRNLWQEKYGVTLDPNSRTSPAILAKNEARQAYQTAIRTFVRTYQTNNPLISDEQRAAAGLPVHKTSRTPAPVPTTMPEYRVDTSIIRRLTVHFQDAGSSSKRKPAGVHGCEIRWDFAAAAPDDVEMLVHSAFDTNSPFTLNFIEADRSKTVWLALRWENTRGEKGPWSEMINVIIP